MRASWRSVRRAALGCRESKHHPLTHFTGFADQLINASGSSAKAAASSVAAATVLSKDATIISPRMPSPPQGTRYENLGPVCGRWHSCKADLGPRLGNIGKDCGLDSGGECGECPSLNLESPSRFMTVNEISDNFSLLDGWVVQNLYYRWSKEFLEAGKTGSQGFSPAYRNCYPIPQLRENPKTPLPNGAIRILPNG